MEAIGECEAQEAAEWKAKEQLEHEEYDKCKLQVIVDGSGDQAAGGEKKC